MSLWSGIAYMRCVLLIPLDRSLSILTLGCLKMSLLTWVEGGQKKFLLSLPFWDQLILNIFSVWLKDQGFLSLVWHYKKQRSPLWKRMKACQQCWSYLRWLSGRSSWIFSCYHNIPDEKDKNRKAELKNKCSVANSDNLHKYKDQHPNVILTVKALSRLIFSHGIFLILKASNSGILNYDRGN